jgi:hypothetical protein
VHPSGVYDSTVQGHDFALHVSSTGFRQYLRQPSMLSSHQYSSSEARGGIGFAEQPVNEKQTASTASLTSGITAPYQPHWQRRSGQSVSGARGCIDGLVGGSESRQVLRRRSACARPA